MGNNVTPSNSRHFSVVSDEMMDPKTASMLLKKSKKMGKLMSLIQNHKKLMRIQSITYPKIRMEEIWVCYMNHATSQRNIFSVMWMDPRVSPLFSDKPKDVAKRQERHVRLAHQTIYNCLRLVATKDFTEATLALHAIGSYHSQRGVTATMFTSFIPLCLNTVETINQEHGYPLTQHDTDLVRGMLEITIQAMMMGLNQHQTTMQYMAVLRKKKRGALTRKRLRSKCVSKDARRSWSNVSEEMMGYYGGH